MLSSVGGAQATSVVGGAQATSVVCEPAVSTVSPHHLHLYNTHRRTSKSQQCDVTTAARQVRSKEALPVIGGSGSKSCQEQDDGAEQQ